ncbi:MAG: helix-turn-helix domain-containing protein [Clostridiales bacterium]|nr:helix-turn-helix domain-containing protein [Clostridiales bacterium]
MIDLLDAKAVYERVDDLRAARGWTIYELAKRAGVSCTAIYNWRDRLSLPSLELLDAVCYAFGITVAEFMADDGDLVALTEEQQSLLQLWNTLTIEKKKSILNLMKTMQD